MYDDNIIKIFENESKYFKIFEKNSKIKNQRLTDFLIYTRDLYLINY